MTSSTSKPQSSEILIGRQTKVIIIKNESGREMEKRLRYLEKTHIFERLVENKDKEMEGTHYGIVGEFESM